MMLVCDLRKSGRVARQRLRRERSTALVKMRDVISALVNISHGFVSRCVLETSLIAITRRGWKAENIMM